MRAGVVNDDVDDAAAMLLPDRLGADEAGRGGERVSNGLAKCSAKLVLLLDAHDMEAVALWRSGSATALPDADQSTQQTKRRCAQHGTGIALARVQLGANQSWRTRITESDALNY